MRAIRIDRGKPVAEEPHLGHDRCHPDIAAVAEVGEGEEIALETRDALDGQIMPGMAGAGLATVEAGAPPPPAPGGFLPGGGAAPHPRKELAHNVPPPPALPAVPTARRVSVAD